MKKRITTAITKGRTICTQWGTTFVAMKGVGDDGEVQTHNTPAPLAAALQQEFADIEKTTRLVSGFDQNKTLVRSLENGAIQKAFYEKKAISPIPLTLNCSTTNS